MHSLQKTLVTLLSATQAFATGCGEPLPVKAGSTTNVSIQSGGIERDYLLHVPSTYDGKNPVSLIFSFHGRGKDATGQKKLSQFSNPEFNPDAISVYPNGIPVSTLYIFFFNRGEGGRALGNLSVVT
jgi:poly(3-hydroxybutyrate) depolymerase